MRKINESKELSLNSIREQALEDVARSVKSIRMQNQAEPKEDELVTNALHNTEEAMFFLAVHAGNDDEKRTRAILKSHDLDDIK